MMTRRVVIACAALLAVACGASSDHPPQSPHDRARLPRDVVERAALPLYGVTTNGERLEPEALFDALSDHEAVCVGENHDNPHHHYAQLAVLEALAARARARGRQLAVGFEMVRRPVQPELDAFATGELAEADLLERIDWHRSWGFDFSLYRPLFEHARDERLALLALNAPQKLTRAVAHDGLEALSMEQREALPELDLSIQSHRRFFDDAMDGHPMPPGTADRMYAAQVVWDETMAETAAQWLTEAPAEPRQIVIFAGLGHCHESAIPVRIERRVNTVSAVAVRPLVLRGDDRQDATDDDFPSAVRFDYRIVLDASGHGD